MKQRYILLIIFFAGITTARAQCLAKDGLPAATSAATAIAADAYLIEITAPKVTDNSLTHMDGTSIMWTYSFFSVSQNLVYNVVYIYASGIPTTYLSATSIPNFTNPPHPLFTTRTWINSDAALSIADGAGGLAFEYPDLSANITMSILDNIGNGTSDNSDSLGWEILYSASSSSLTICVNAESGVVVCNTPSKGSGVADESANAQPVLDQLSQNFPNPFEASTTISFSLPRSQNVALSVYNTLGGKVAGLAHGELSEGAHTFTFDAANLPEGVYYYRFIASGIEQIKPMLIVK